MASPAVVVHHLDHILAVLDAAMHAGVPVILLTPRGGAGYAGAPYYRAALAQGKAAFPEVEATMILDCGDDAALAVAALAAGWNRLVLAGSARARGKVAAIAAAQGAEVLARRPKSIDLDTAPDLQEICRRILKMA